MYVYTTKVTVSKERIVHIRFASSSCCCSANFYLAFFIFRNLYQKQCIEFVNNMLEPCGSPVTSLATVVILGDSLQQKT